MRLPRSYGSRLYLAHLVVVAVALVLVAGGWWRLGTVLVGASFTVAAAARIVVSEDQTGMLRVRGKIFDVLWMGFLGTALVVLGLLVPGDFRT